MELLKMKATDQLLSLAEKIDDTITSTNIIDF